MQPLARALEREGYSILNIPYPSGRLPIDTLARRIRAEVATHTGERPVHFITHSLGGIITRAILSDEVPWQTGRIVMLAPPSNGSEIVDWSSSHPLLHFVLGPAGRDLGSTGAPAHLPHFPQGTEAAVIMGKRSTVPLFRKLLGSENDGIVSVEKGRIEGLSGFSVVDADHTFIQMHPDTIRLSLQFIKSGVWAA